MIKQEQSIKERSEKALRAPFVVGHSVDREKFPLLAANMDRANAPKFNGGGALSEAERLRLVKGSKCPTSQNDQDLAAIDELIARANCKPDKLRAMYKTETGYYITDYGFDNCYLNDKAGEDPAGWVFVESIDERLPETVKVQGREVMLEPFARSGELVRKRENLKGAGKFAVITHREWSDEYRIRVEVEQAHGRPPEQSGERVTKSLSMRGARAIADSCHYMAEKKGGYSTFLTLTLDSEARARVAEGDSSVQKEISRFFDACQKLYQRGWTNEKTGNSLGGHDEPLHYCWVVECPKNEAGEDNPHAHILMKWRVPYREFEGWSERIETLWGQGFAHLEKIKEPEKAGAYMAKAAGYLTKAAGESDQGVIRGNRYGISKASRAPEWALLHRFEAGIMGSLIKDTHDYFSHLYGHHFKERKQLNEKMAETPKNSPDRRKIGARLEKVRSVLNELPAVASKYQILLKGVGAFSQFMDWAQADCYVPDGEWLPSKDKGDKWSASDNKPVYFEKLSQSVTGYFARLKRKKWLRGTAADFEKWLDDVGGWFGRCEIDSQERFGFVPEYWEGVGV